MISSVLVRNFKNWTYSTDRILLSVEHGDTNLTAICGRNGSGKSSLIQAIQWCAFGESAKHLGGGLIAGLANKNSTNNSVVLDGTETFNTDDMYVEVEFYDKPSKQSFKICRRYEKDTNKVQTSIVSIHQPSSALSAATSTVQKNVSAAALKSKLKSINIDTEYINQIVINQNMSTIAGQSPLKLLEYLEHISGTEEFKTLQVTHYNNYMAYQIELKDKHSQVDQTVHQLRHEFQSVRNEIESKIHELKSTLNQLQQIKNNQLQVCKQELTKLTDTTLPVIATQKQSIHDELQAKQLEVNTLSSQLHNLIQTEKSCKKQLHKSQQLLEQSSAKHKESLSEQQAYQSKLTSIAKKIKSQQKEISSLRSQEDRINATLLELRSSVTTVTTTVNNNINSCYQNSKNSNTTENTTLESSSENIPPTVILENNPLDSFIEDSVTTYISSLQQTNSLVHTTQQSLHLHESRLNDLKRRQEQYDDKRSTHESLLQTQTTLLTEYTDLTQRYEALSRQVSAKERQQTEVSERLNELKCLQEDAGMHKDDNLQIKLRRELHTALSRCVSGGGSGSTDSHQSVRVSATAANSSDVVNSCGLLCDLLQPVSAEYCAPLLAVLSARLLVRTLVVMTRTDAIAVAQRLATQFPHIQGLSMDIVEEVSSKKIPRQTNIPQQQYHHQQQQSQQSHQQCHQQRGQQMQSKYIPLMDCVHITDERVVSVVHRKLGGWLLFRGSYEQAIADKQHLTDAAAAAAAALSAIKTNTKNTNTNTGNYNNNSNNINSNSKSISSFNTFPLLLPEHKQQQQQQQREQRWIQGFNIVTLDGFVLLKDGEIRGTVQRTGSSGSGSGPNRAYWPGSSSIQPGSSSTETASTMRNMNASSDSKGASATATATLDFTPRDPSPSTHRASLAQATDQLRAITTQLTELHSNRTALQHSLTESQAAQASIATQIQQNSQQIKQLKVVSNTDIERLQSYINNDQKSINALTADCTQHQHTLIQTLTQAGFFPSSSATVIDTDSSTTATTTSSSRSTSKIRGKSTSDTASVGGIDNNASTTVVINDTKRPEKTLQQQQSSASSSLTEKSTVTVAALVERVERQRAAETTRLQRLADIRVKECELSALQQRLHASAATLQQQLALQCTLQSYPATSEGVLQAERYSALAQEAVSSENECAECGRRYQAAVQATAAVRAAHTKASRTLSDLTLDYASAVQRHSRVQTDIDTRTLRLHSLSGESERVTLEQQSLESLPVFPDWRLLLLSAENDDNTTTTTNNNKKKNTNNNTAADTTNTLTDDAVVVDCKDNGHDGSDDEGGSGSNGSNNNSESESACKKATVQLRHRTANLDKQTVAATKVEATAATMESSGEAVDRRRLTRNPMHTKTKMPTSMSLSLQEHEHEHDTKPKHEDDDEDEDDDGLVDTSTSSSSDFDSDDSDSSRSKSKSKSKRGSGRVTVTAVTAVESRRRTTSAPLITPVIVPVTVPPSTAAVVTAVDQQLLEEKLGLRWRSLSKRLEEIDVSATHTRYMQVYTRLQSLVAEVTHTQQQALTEQSQSNLMLTRRFTTLCQFLRGLNTQLSHMYSFLVPDSDVYLNYAANPISLFEEGVQALAQHGRSAWREMSSLSGGQQAAVGLSLLLAVQACRPSPLYMLDEVDASLDSRTVLRLGALLRQRSTEAQCQFIVVSHRAELHLSASRVVGVYACGGAPACVSMGFE